MINIVVLFLLLCSFSSCMDREQLVDCYYTYLEEVKEHEEYHIVLEAFSDTLDLWIDNYVKGLYYLKSSYWRVDSALFFNESKDKVLLFLLSLEKPNPETIRGGRAGIKIVSGERIGDIWKFYYQANPWINYYRDYFNADPELGFEELSEQGIYSLCKDGFILWVLKLACWVNYDYVDSEELWFEWKRKKHQNFLDGVGWGGVLPDSVPNFSELVNKNRM